MNINIESQKKCAAVFSINTLIKEKLIHSGMTIGLGTGSTALYAVRYLAECIAEKQITNIAAVPSSFQTKIACEQLGIPIYSLGSKRINGSIELTIDGADQIDAQKNLTKGGGAALLKEKIIAYNSDVFVIIADETKQVISLGITFPVPIEIIPEAAVSITKQLEQSKITVCLREGIKKQGPVITDNGNFILDLTWQKNTIICPTKLEKSLKSMTGVVESGFFTQKIPRIFLGNHTGTAIEYIPL